MSKMVLIQLLLDEMRPLTLEAGVAPEKYQSIIDGIEEDDLFGLHTWLKEVRDGAYQAAFEIKRLLPQEVWDQYKRMGEHDLREQVLLREKLKLLRIAWRKPFHVKRKNKPKRTKETIDPMPL